MRRHVSLHLSRPTAALAAHTSARDGGLDPPKRGTAGLRGDVARAAPALAPPAAAARDAAVTATTAPRSVGRTLPGLSCDDAPPPGNAARSPGREPAGGVNGAPARGGLSPADASAELRSAARARSDCSAALSDSASSYACCSAE